MFRVNFATRQRDRRNFPFVQNGIILSLLARCYGLLCSNIWVFSSDRFFTVAKTLKILEKSFISFSSFGAYLFLPPRPQLFIFSIKSPSLLHCVDLFPPTPHCMGVLWILLGLHPFIITGVCGRP